jgi:putative DNA primase/helicase
VPAWLASLNAPARAPQKPPPPGGVLPVERWSIPQELRNHRAWACWRYEFYAERWSKPPYNPETGARAEPSDSSTWSDFDSCYDAYRVAAVPEAGDARPYDGVSFAIDPRWGLVGIDLDHVKDHYKAAVSIISALDSYTELSPSRDGVRMFVKGTLPEGRRRREWREFYSARRFLTVTGQHVEGTPETIRRSPKLLSVWHRWVQQDS